MLDLVWTYEKSSQWKKDIPLYEKIIEINENLMSGYGSLTFDKKRTLISENAPIYESAVDLYYRDNNFKDAFRIFTAFVFDKNSNIKVINEKELNKVAKLFGTKKFFRKKFAAESNLKTSSRRDKISNYK